MIKISGPNKTAARLIESNPGHPKKNLLTPEINTKNKSIREGIKTNTETFDQVNRKMKPKKPSFRMENEMGKISAIEAGFLEGLNKEAGPRLDKIKNIAKEYWGHTKALKKNIKNMSPYSEENLVKSDAIRNQAGKILNQHTDRIIKGTAKRRHALLDVHRSALESSMKAKDGAMDNIVGGLKSGINESKFTRELDKKSKNLQEKALRIFKRDMSKMDQVTKEPTRNVGKGLVIPAIGGGVVGTGTYIATRKGKNTESEKMAMSKIAQLRKILIEGLVKKEASAVGVVGKGIKAVKSVASKPNPALKSAIGTPKGGAIAQRLGLASSTMNSMSQVASKGARRSAELLKKMRDAGPRLDLTKRLESLKKTSEKVAATAYTLGFLKELEKISGMMKIGSTQLFDALARNAATIDQALKIGKPVIRKEWLLGRMRGKGVPKDLLKKF